MGDDGFSITAVVTAAAHGDQAAWNDIVDRFSPLLAAVLQQCGLSRADAEDAAQTVWLRLVENLDKLREARALPMWIVTTGRREAWRQAASHRRVQAQDPGTGPWTRQPASGETPDDVVVRSERQQALLTGLATLPTRDRELLLLFLQDPPPSYAEISRRTGIPIGGVGPTRARALDKLRRAPSMQAIVADECDSRDSAAQVRG